jgi:CRISPR system Cascade subunit CasB
VSLSINATVAWWRDLQPDLNRNRSGDRAGLARLRRCATVAEAMQDSATISLLQRCGGTGPWHLPAAGLAAAVLAHVREDDREHPRVARRVGPDNSDKPKTALLKPLRFRHLLEADLPDERLASFRRLAALANGKLNVSDVAGALLDWNEGRRRLWVYDYWNAGQPTAAPYAEETTS